MLNFVTDRKTKKCVTMQLKNLLKNLKNLSIKICS